MKGVPAGPVRLRLPAFGAVGLVASTLATTTLATAHPHVFPLVQMTALFDDSGRFSGVHQKWTFDTDFSGPIKLTVDEDQDGVMSGAEVAKALATHGVLSWMVTSDYFTRLTVAGRPVAHDVPSDIALTFADGRLLIEFTLPLKQPAAVVLGAGIDVFDPEFYLDFEFDHGNVAADKPPSNCNVAVREGTNLDPVAVMLIRALGLKADPAVIADPAAGYAVRVAIDCK